ncbi:MAG: hypothetical protein AUJ75_00140 [Candidatus Omnitrophica bacterium CG1_02_49_10]|nr:MAG: hypothetical protein AUJ75_00140 [Candidatus Omnitrophica bacterium CG1_02_49_10]
MNNKSDNRETPQRVIALLDRSEIDFLDSLGKDSLFSTGSKLTRTKILKALVDTLMKTDITGKDIKGRDDLERAIVACMHKVFEEAAKPKEQ